MKFVKNNTTKDPNKFCIDDVLDCVKKAKKAKKKKAKKPYN